MIDALIMTIVIGVPVTAILAGAWALCCIAAPATEEERRADDEAQIEYLNNIRRAGL